MSWTRRPAPCTQAVSRCIVVYKVMAGDTSEAGILEPCLVGTSNQYRFLKDAYFTFVARKVALGDSSLPVIFPIFSKSCPLAPERFAHNALSPSTRSLPLSFRGRYSSLLSCRPHSHVSVTWRNVDPSILSRNVTVLPWTCLTWSHPWNVWKSANFDSEVGSWSFVVTLPFVFLLGNPIQIICILSSVKQSLRINATHLFVLDKASRHTKCSLFLADVSLFYHI